MELARLASNKQQASAAGPFLGPRATRVPKSKKSYHAVRDGFPQLSREQIFFWSDPHVVGSGHLLGFWPVLGRGHLEKSRARAENRKTQFPGTSGTFGKQSVRPKIFSPKLRNCFTFCVLAERTPTGRKSQNNGFLRPFRPRAALGTWRNSGRKTAKHKQPHGDRKERTKPPSARS